MARITKKEQLQETLYQVKEYVLSLRKQGEELCLDNWPKVKECTKKKYRGTYQVTFYLKGQDAPKEKVGLDPTEAAHLYMCLLTMLTSREIASLPTSDLEYGQSEESMKLVTDYYFEYMEQDKARGYMKPATVLTYTEIWNTYLAPFYKGIRVCDLSISMMSDLRAYVADLKKRVLKTEEKEKGKIYTEDPLSQRRKGEIWRINRRLLERLKEDELIPENYTTGFKGFPCGKPTSTDGYWKEDQFNAVMQHVTYPQYRLFYMICFYCGLRRGEAMALRFSDVDWKRKGINVSRTYNCQTQLFGTTKTGNTRFLYVPDILFRELEAHREKSQFRIETYGEDSLICSRNDGENLVLPAESIRRILDEAVINTGDESIQRVKIHTLRKSYVTNALKANNNLDAVAKAAGHMDPTITMDVYLRSNDEDLRRIAESMGKINQ